MSRPFIKLWAYDLLALANESTNQDVLNSILHELQSRSRKAARKVRPQVEARIAQLMEESFQWPTTEAPDGRKALPAGTVFKYRDGMLKYLGYSVAETGPMPELRREVLDRVYKYPLPFFNSAAYTEGWGQPATGPRLRKMAESIATFCRNAKRNDPRRHAVAISHWEADLAYLKKSYCDGRYNFGWPVTNRGLV